MVEDRNKYVCPLGTRYGKDMSSVFSDTFKFSMWRKCWVALAESEFEVGVKGITLSQIEQLRENIGNINYEVAEKIEKEIRQDVMAHVRAYGEQCPEAKAIIHLGGTSCCITDNTELIQMYAGLKIINKKLINTIKLLRDFSLKYKDLPILAFTHYQPAQPTTLGKRTALWCQDLMMDYEEINCILDKQMLRGLKGATGTQASYMELCEGDENKVEELNRRFLEKMGFSLDFLLTSQTYPRKYDSIIIGRLAGIAESAHKAGNDMRIMQSRKEMEEPFEETQVGSTAMAYKRNPMRAERMCALARDVIGNEPKPRMTASTQWFERTLDDSAGRRVYVPQSFIATDEVLNLYMNIMENPVVYPNMIRRNLEAEIPFMATENIMMKAVKKGKDRQQIHEIIRQHSQEAARRIKEEGKDNGLLKMLADDERIGLTMEEILNEVDVNKFIGRAPSQVRIYMEKVDEMLKKEESLLGLKSKVTV